MEGQNASRDTVDTYQVLEYLQKLLQRDLTCDNIFYKKAKFKPRNNAMYPLTHSGPSGLREGFPSNNTDLDPDLCPRIDASEVP